MKHKAKIDETTTVRNPSYLISPTSTGYVVDYYQDKIGKSVYKDRDQALNFITLRIPDTHVMLVVDLGEVKHGN